MSKNPFVFVFFRNLDITVVGLGAMAPRTRLFILTFYDESASFDAMGLKLSENLIC